MTSVSSGPIHVLHVIDSLGSAGGAERGFVQEVSRFTHVRSTVVVLCDSVPLKGVLVEYCQPPLRFGDPWKTKSGPSSRQRSPRTIRVLATSQKRLFRTFGRWVE